MAATTAEYAILGLLGFGERSGYDLARSASNSIAFMGVPSRSQIYKVLPRLVRRGWAQSRSVEQESLPDKVLYRLTEAGRDALRAWVEDVDDDPETGNDVYLLKIFFGWAASAEAARAQLVAYRGLIERRLAIYRELDEGFDASEPVHSRVAVRHGIARASATLQWVEEAERLLP